MSEDEKVVRCPRCGLEGRVADWLAGDSIKGATFIVYCPGGPLYASEEAEKRGDAPIGTLPRTYECPNCGRSFEEAKA